MLKSHLNTVFPFVFLCVVLCDPLCLSILQLNTKEPKVCTKAHKGLFEQPHLNAVKYIIDLSGLLRFIIFFNPGKLKRSAKP